jgi:uncharacterized membrane protein YgcG
MDRPNLSALSHRAQVAGADNGGEFDKPSPREVLKMAQGFLGYRLPQDQYSLVYSFLLEWNLATPAQVQAAAQLYNALKDKGLPVTPLRTPTFAEDTYVDWWRATELLKLINASKKASAGKGQGKGQGRGRGGGGGGRARGRG